MKSVQEILNLCYDPVNKRLNTDVSVHAADLDAHTRNLCEAPLVGKYWCGIPVYNATTTGIATGAMQATLIYVPRTITFDRIAIGITVAMAAGKKAMLSLYNHNETDFKPSTLILDEEIAGDATGVIAATISQQLTKGLYWAVVDPEDSVTYRSFCSAIALMGYDGTTWANIVDLYYASHTYGPAPATFPTAGTGYFHARAGGVQLRVASLD